MVDLFEVDLRFLVDGHQEEIVLLVLEEQVFGVPAGDFTAQRLRIGNGEERCMPARRNLDAQAGQESEKLVFSLGHAAPPIAAQGSDIAIRAPYERVSS